MQIVVTPVLNLILLFYKIFFNNLGLAIVSITIFINLALFPLTQKSMKMAKKQQELKPKLDELKKKYAKDQTKLVAEQTKLFREHGINPATGCFPSIIQLVLLIALINAFSGILSGNSEIVGRLNALAYFPFLKIDASAGFNTKFLVFDLSQRDIIKLPFSFNLLGIYVTEIPGILVISSAVFQFFSAKLMLPTVKSEEKFAKETESSTDDLASNMQKQMLYLFPLMYLWFGTRYSSGLALYFLTSSIFSLLRQLVTSGKLRSVSGRFL